MAVRDDEITRLIHYAKGMGVKVIIYSKSKDGASAEWTPMPDDSTIQVYAGSKKSKTEIILDLIHELGHHIWFVHEKDRQVKLVEDKLDEDAMSKRLRKKILDEEIAGTAYWDVIVKDTNIKIPTWKINAAKEFDMWMYQVYYETGQFPKGKARNDHYREVQKKHRPR